MSNGIVAEAFWKVTQWGVARRLAAAAPPAAGTGRRGREAGRPRPAHDEGAGSSADPAPSSTGVERSGALGAPLREQLEALVEEHLQVRDRAALQEHVPVRARRLDLLLLGRRPSISREMLPCRRHSQVAGASASFANGTSNSCPRGQA